MCNAVWKFSCSLSLSVRGSSTNWRLKLARQFRQPRHRGAREVNQSSLVYVHIAILLYIASPAQSSSFYVPFLFFTWKIAAQMPFAPYFSSRVNSDLKKKEKSFEMQVWYWFSNPFWKIAFFFRLFLLFWNFIYKIFWRPAQLLLSFLWK